MDRVFAALLLLSTSGATAVGIEFPGATKADSPDSEYVIRYVPPTLASPQHVLVLEGAKTHQTVELYRFNRHVEVLWAPNSQMLAINDFTGSTATTCWVMRLGEGALRKENVRERLEAMGGMRAKLQGNLHAFVRALKWKATSTLSIRVYGYGERDPDGFDVVVDYPVERENHARKTN